MGKLQAGVSGGEERDEVSSFQGPQDGVISW
jgi:hypothetical protein